MNPWFIAATFWVIGGATGLGFALDAAFGETGACGKTMSEAAILPWFVGVILIFFGAVHLIERGMNR